MFTEMHFKEKQRFNFISGCIESLLLRGYFAFVMILLCILQNLRICL